MTAGGAVFFGIEDETGMANVMVTKGLWSKQRVAALSTRLVVIRGIVYNSTGAASVTADLIEPVEAELVAAGMGQAAQLGSRSRDFQ